MSIILAVVLSVSAAPAADAEAATTKAAPAVTARSGRELADAAHTALRKWAKAGDQEADAAAKDLLAIYCEIQQDTQLARSTRETLRTTVRGRLDQLSTQISKRIAKDKAADKTAKPDAKVKSVAPAGNDRPLAQVGVPAGGGLGVPGGRNANADYGQALVDLIQNTISTKSWDVNGGNASISYWQQQHALVVRATSEVHGQISDVMEQLNRATH